MFLSLLLAGSGSSKKPETRLKETTDRMSMIDVGKAKEEEEE